MKSIAASAYVLELSGEIIQDEGDPLVALYAVALDAAALARAFASTAADDRLLEILQRVVFREQEDPHALEPFTLRLWTVQAGKLSGSVDLRPHVQLIDGERRVPLDTVMDARTAIDELDMRFEVRIPALAPLANPVLAAGQRLRVMVPDDLADMTELELGENHVEG